MGIVDDMFESVKSSLKWKAQSTVVNGVDKGIRSIFSKGKNKCPQCGKTVEDHSAIFCPNCRANLVLTCPNPECQKISPLKTKFCPACGAKLQPDNKKEA